VISLRQTQRRRLSAILALWLALWLALCAVAVCMAAPQLGFGDLPAVLDGAGESAGQDHCAAGDGESRCDDRRASDHRNLADLLPLLVLFALPLFALPRLDRRRVARRREPLRRHSLPLHLLNCVQLN